MGKRGPNATKEKPWADALRIALNRPDEANPDRKNLMAIAEACVNAAKAGDMQAVKEIGDRMDGKATTRLEHTGANGGPIQTEQVNSDADAFRSRIAGLASRLATHGGVEQPQ